jgi:mono/diheme cytochrome c family protein
MHMRATGTELAARLRLAGALWLCAVLSACGDLRRDGGAQPHVAAASDVAAGRYLMIVANCNDCHTDGYVAAKGPPPEADWGTGVKHAFLGPWGATYPANLRLSVQSISEDDWVKTMRTRKDLPPMPWVNVNQMSEHDSRAIYRYLRSLGPKGERAKSPLPPGVTPPEPYESMMLIDARPSS